MEQEGLVDILVSWRGRQLTVETDSCSDFKELGMKLLKLTNVKAETMKLLIPLSSNKGSKLVTPFSAEDSGLLLAETSILEGKPVRMMGVSEGEIEEVSHDGLKPNLRIIGFEEEEKRMKQRLSGRPHNSLKLPQGPYTFCDFRTLHIPGMELNPPSSEALRRMHMLACDPGIVAIMNKHHWRVGIMTEMAPVGYVGISPKCLLGLNKNHGEEISLRLRTDDLKGFRKYESIKKTLLHELAHMVYSEHDANFYALDKQLNQEADDLDWTKSRSLTLSGKKVSNSYEYEDFSELSYSNMGQKLGGSSLSSSSSARALSVAAAYSRYLDASNSTEEILNEMETKKTDNCPISEKGELSSSIELDKDDDGIVKIEPRKHSSEAGSTDVLLKVDVMVVDHPSYVGGKSIPSPVENEVQDESEPTFVSSSENFAKCDLGDTPNGTITSCREPDPDESQLGKTTTCHANQMELDGSISSTTEVETQDEPLFLGREESSQEPECILDPKISHPNDDSLEGESLKSEPDPDASMDDSEKLELRRIEEPVAVFCDRLRSAIEALRSEATPLKAPSALKTLFKIIRNVIEHPDELKFRRLRKRNPLFQRELANYRAAIEVLALIGFCEDVVIDEFGRSETYMILKRNDPGLLWLAKSSLELSFA